MNFSKNKKYQYSFFLLILIYSIFNGGNSNLIIQINFLLISFFYIFCLKDKNYNKHFTYLGTGCIFKFDDEHPFGEEINGFDEESEPNFFDSSYSVVKGFTDELMHLLDSNTLNLRIRMPITSCHSKRNFIKKITTYEKICSVPNSMTVGISK